MRTKLLLLVALAMLTGCVGMYQPIVDTRGLDMNQYNADLNECQQLGARVDPGASTVVSAGVGALIGAAIGAFLGDSRTASQLAGAGAVIGGSSGGTNAVVAQQNIVRDCLIQHGYTVYN